MAENTAKEDTLPTFVSRNGGYVKLVFPDVSRQVVVGGNVVFERVPVGAVSSDEAGVIRPRDAEEAERIEARYGKTLVRKVDSLDEAKRVARIAAAALPGSSVKLGPETPREKAKRLFEEAKAAMAEAGVDAYDLGSYAGAPEEAVDEQGDIAPFGNDIRHQTPTPVGNEVPGDGPQVDPDKSEDDQHDGAPDKQPKGLQVTEHADVTTVSDAAEILTTQYHMTADVLKGGNGRPSRENVLLVAKQVGASFPNLPTS